MKKPPAGAAFSIADAKVDYVEQDFSNIIPLYPQVGRPKDKIESLRRIQHFHRTATSRQPGEPWPSTRKFGLGIGCSSDEFAWPGGVA